MPLPTPNQGETNQQFVDRCMADPKVNEEFPDREQRFAICNAQIDKSIKEKMDLINALKLFIKSGI